MRKFKPAPKQASANRIRERYLHQLGLQRGSASSHHAAWNSDDTNTKHHVVVISGLPSLPEDRATNGNVLESHDFSQRADGGASLDEGGANHVAIAVGGDASHCSKSTLSTSPHGTSSSYNGGGGCMADEKMTAMALACPHSLLKSPHHHAHSAMGNTTPNNANAASNGNGNSSALPFISWGTSQLSRSAAVLLDESRGGGMNDHDSVSSAVTASTAESSFTATMLSRDWGAAASSATTTTTAVVNGLPTPSGTASVSSMGDSVTSAPGVFFQPRPSSYTTTTTTTNNNNNNCATSSSLAMALHRFNIDSDCEASIASNSIMEDPTTMMEDCTIMDDAASCTSHVSCGSSIASTTSATKNRAAKKKKKKIGKNQRLLERANAQERMMQKKMVRAGMVQRGMCSSGSSSLVGLPMPLHLGGTTTTSVGCGGSSVRSCSSSVVSQASSIPLMHVDHQASSTTTTTSSMSKTTPVNASMCMSNGDTTSNVVVSLSPQELQQHHPEQDVFLAPVVLPKRPSFGGGDLGRTPTASNCSQHATTATSKMSLPLPVGVYSNYLQDVNSCRPLGYHPQLVSQAPTPAISSFTNSLSHAASGMEVNVATVGPQVPGLHSNQDCTSAPPPTPTVDTKKSVEDDVMEVAVTLSMLGNRTMVPSSNGGG